MRKVFIASALLISSFCTTPSAFAYSDELKEFSELLNSEISDINVEYDGKDLIMNFPSSLLSDDELELIESIDDDNVFASIVKMSVISSIDGEISNMLGSVLQQFDANLILRLQLPQGAVDILITPEELYK